MILYFLVGVETRLLTFCLDQDKNKYENTPLKNISILF